MTIMGEGALRYNFNLLPKVLAEFPIYSSSHSNLSHLYLNITVLFFVMLPLSFSTTMGLMMVLLPLKWIWMPTLPQMFLKLAKTLSIRYHHMDVAVVNLVGVGVVLVSVSGMCITELVVAFGLKSAEGPCVILASKAPLMSSSSL